MMLAFEVPVYDNDYTAELLNTNCYKLKIHGDICCSLSNDLIFGLLSFTGLSIDVTVIKRKAMIW